MDTLVAMKVIRPLQIEELPLCAPFGKAFHLEKGIHGDFAIDVFVKNWTVFLQSYPAIIYGLWDGDRLVGGLGGMVTPDLTTGTLSAVEFFWYVDPAYRTGTWPFRLVKAFRKWGKHQGATRLRMVHMLLEGEDPSQVRLAHVYQQLGLRAIEVNYDGPIDGRD